MTAGEGELYRLERHKRKERCSGIRSRRNLKGGRKLPPGRKAAIFGNIPQSLKAVHQLCWLSFQIPFRLVVRREWAFDNAATRNACAPEVRQGVIPDKRGWTIKANPARAWAVLSIPP